MRDMNTQSVSLLNETVQDDTLGFRAISGPDWLEGWDWYLWCQRILHESRRTRGSFGSSKTQETRSNKRPGRSEEGVRLEPSIQASLTPRETRDERRKRQPEMPYYYCTRGTTRERNLFSLLPLDLNCSWHMKEVKRWRASTWGRKESSQLKRWSCLSFSLIHASRQNKFVSHCSSCSCFLLLPPLLLSTSRKTFGWSNSLFLSCPFCHSFPCLPPLQSNAWLGSDSPFISLTFLLFLFSLLKHGIEWCSPIPSLLFFSSSSPPHLFICLPLHLHDSLFDSDSKLSSCLPHSAVRDSTSDWVIDLQRHTYIW